MAEWGLRLTGRPVVVMGRAGMDLYADPPGTPAEGAVRFMAALGGSAGNIAAGLVRLGQAADLLSAVSDDAVGRFVVGQIAAFGIGAEHVKVVSGDARTSLAVTETRAVGAQTVIYRNGAADFAVSPDDVMRIDMRRQGGLIVTGTALAQEPSRGAAMAAIAAAAAAGVPVILDVDYRAYSWRSAEEVRSVCLAAAHRCDMIVGNDTEFAMMAGSGDGRSLARALGAAGRIAIYKMGAEGSETYAPAGGLRCGIFAVTAIKPMGAGDAFMAGLVAALVEGRPLAEAVLRGSAAAAIVVCGIGCAPAMPDRTALDAFIAGHRPPQTARLPGP
jgi:5-dehydro-2-deoxygluconokinase